MKKLIITILATLLILSLVGCAGTNETADPEFSACDTDTSADTSDNEKDSNIPEFNYTGDLYKYDHTYNDYEGGYILVEDLPWEGYPTELPLIGGYMDLSLGGGSISPDDHSLFIFTRGGDDAEIANWYRQQLESADWVVTDFEVSEQYGSTRFNFSNDNWYGDFVVQSEDSALGGYDGCMPRSESDFEKTAVIVDVMLKKQICCYNSLINNESNEPGDSNANSSAPIDNETQVAASADNTESEKKLYNTTEADVQPEQASAPE